jgi:hypothetical protein
MAAPTKRRQKDQALMAARQRITALRELLDAAEDECAQGVPVREIALRADDKLGRIRIAVSDYVGLLP